jgi:hypothetical protein
MVATNCLLRKSIHLKLLKTKKVKKTICRGQYGAALQELEKNLQTAHYFLLTLDPATKKLEISGYPKMDLEKASNDYLSLEKTIKGTSKDAVLVSVDSITALRRAYPNYFLDTNVFSSLVTSALTHF